MSIAECVGQKLPSFKRIPSNRSHHPQQNGNFTLTGRTAPDFTASRFVGQSCGLGSGVRPTHFFISFFRCAPRGAVVNTPGGIRYTQGAHPPYYHERLQTTTGSLAPLYGCSADLDPWTPRSGCMSTIRPLHAASRFRRPLRMLALLPIYDDSFSCFVVPVGLWGDSESQASRTLGHALTSTGRP